MAMEDVTLAHAKEHLEELIEKAARGEDVRITDGKQRTIRLVPADTKTARAGRVVIGQWKGRVNEIPPEKLLEPLTDEELAWLSGEKSSVD